MTTDRDQPSANTLRARVTGQVQGVGFRAWTRQQARRIGLDGWVRNEADGSVTALISGSRARVAELVKALHRGPPGARVASVLTQPAEPPGLPGFHINL